MICPSCKREWEAPCEQTLCIERYGACVVCRYRDHMPEELTHAQAQIELKSIVTDNANG